MQNKDGNGAKFFRHKPRHHKTGMLSILIALILVGVINVVKLTEPVFGSLYGNGASRPVIDEVPIEFDTRGPLLNTDPDPATNTITVQNSGVYEVTATLSFVFSASPAAQQAVFFIKVNDSFFTADVAFDAAVNGDVDLVLNAGKTIQLGLHAGDKLSVVPTGVAGEVNYRLASLTVKRIGPRVVDRPMKN